ncbi:uncharacterized protein DUF2512 [Scopulibacillus darangshiensis]|uniref:Uncharacterized protein DUF2512 n=1 Tax=Scopulibacillus darangshiensis TaxID=442528 RepID=A0A4R2P715_9BACL|nr:DUF2512 family protein [Scopulibacillus darangshiensis]TCP29781.1 uncharacterized protein DUF2512 [Scopulibacillus darangshiensis]
MTNLILKIVVTPVIILIADMFSNNQINYGAIYEGIVIGVIIGIVNCAVEMLMLRKGTVWMTTVADFVISLCIVFFGSRLYNDAFVGGQGALVLGVVIAAFEYTLHVWLLRNNYRAAARV